MPRIEIAVILVCLGIGATGLSGSEPQQPDLTRYPTFGVAFRVPKGWEEQLRDKGKTVARWLSPGSVPKNPTAMIVVECGHTPDRSVDEVARGLAKNFNGAVADRPTTLDGTRALRIVANNDGRTLRPVEGLAAIHDGLLYLVMGGVTTGHSVADELEAIRASWKWLPIEPPYKHLEFRDEPLSFSGAVATINVPALMHTYPTEHPDRVLDLGLPNVLRNAPDFLAYVQILPMAQGHTFDEFKNRLSVGTQSQYKVKRPLEWRELSKKPQRVVSEAIEIETPDKVSGKKQMFLICWALVNLDDRRLVLVNFTLPPEAQRGRDTYIALVDQIVASIKPGVAADRIEERPKPNPTRSISKPP
jgi:hypothetical protein